MKWQIVPAESTLRCSVRRWPGRRSTAHFTQFSGAASFVPGAPEKASLTLTIQTDSLTTQPTARARALLAARRLAARSYPTINFTTMRVQHRTDRTDPGYEMTGYLTIRNMTRRIQFPVTFDELQQSADGAFQTVCRAQFNLPREDWGLAWDRWRMRLGLVGKQITCDVTLVLSQSDAPIAVELPLATDAAPENAAAEHAPAENQNAEAGAS